jgi:hypothetical protein
MLRHGGRSEEFDGNRDAIRARIMAPRLDDEYLVWQLPELAALPWHWLDTPGWDALDRNLPVDIEPSDLADLWVVTTSATHPMSAGDRLLLAQLAAIATPAQVLVVITRCDQIETGRLNELSAYVDRIVGQIWPSDPPVTLAVSSLTKHGLEGLRDRLATAVFSHMTGRLSSELATWRKMLEELEEIGRMRSLASLESNTVDTARERLHAELSVAIAELKGSVDALTQDVVDSLEEELPAAQRMIAPLFARRLEERVKRAIEAIGGRLEKELARVLGGDLHQKGSVSLALRAFTTLIDRRSPDVFEARGAMMGASLGAAGLSAALFATLPLIGIPLAVAYLAGGLAGGALGALLGGREILVDTERLRERVGVPLAREVVAELDRVMAAARIEIDRLCDVMDGAAALQHGSPSSSGPAATVREAVSAAKTRAAELSVQVDTLRSESSC